MRSVDESSNNGSVDRANEKALEQVTLIRHRQLAIVLEGQPGQWTWEVAVSGIPDRESGMILPLPELDEFLSNQAATIDHFQIKSANEWFDRAAQAFQQVTQRNASISCFLSWQRLISSSMVYQWLASPLEER
jgi:hypothetical protein